MSKSKKHTIEVNVEIVENLIQSFEWFLSTVNFWKLNDKFPINLACRIFAEYYYQLRKIMNKNENELYDDSKLIL